MYQPSSPRHALACLLASVATTALAQSRADFPGPQPMPSHNPTQLPAPTPISSPGATPTPGPLTPTPGPLTPTPGPIEPWKPTPPIVTPQPLPTPNPGPTPLPHPKQPNIPNTPIGSTTPRQRLIDRIQLLDRRGTVVIIYNDATWVLARPNLFGSSVVLGTWCSGEDWSWINNAWYPRRIIGTGSGYATRRDVRERVPSQQDRLATERREAARTPRSPRDEALGALRRMSPADAVTVLTPYVAAHPSDHVAQRALGLALLGAGRATDAYAVMRAAYVADPALAATPVSAGAIPSRATSDWLQRAVGDARRLNSGSAWLTAATLAHAARRLDDAERMIKNAKAAGLESTIADRYLDALAAQSAAEDAARAVRRSSP